MTGFARVAHVSPLQIVLFGDVTPVPAKAYGLTLAVDDVVRVELLPPRPPQVTERLA